MADNTLAKIRNAVRNRVLLSTPAFSPVHLGFDNIHKENEEKARLREIADKAFTKDD